MMKTVRQKDEIGCGIACVAMLSGVTYDEARKTLFPKGAVKRTSSGKLFDALRKFGRKPVAKRMISLKHVDLDHFADDCLVGAFLGSDRHWVVWDAAAKRIRDPYKGDYQLKVVKYMPVK